MYLTCICCWFWIICLLGYCAIVHLHCHVQSQITNQVKSFSSYKFTFLLTDWYVTLVLLPLVAVFLLFVPAIIWFNAMPRLWLPRNGDFSIILYRKQKNRQREAAVQNKRIIWRCLCLIQLILVFFVVAILWFISIEFVNESK